MKQLDKEQQGSAKTITEMAEEIRKESRAEKRSRVVREFIETAHSKTRASPEDIELLVEAYVLDPMNQREVPSLMRMFQDTAHPEQEIAQRARDHMLDAERNGETVGIRLAVAHLEMIAAGIIYTDREQWGVE